MLPSGRFSLRRVEPILAGAAGVLGVLCGMAIVTTPGSLLLAGAVILLIILFLLIPMRLLPFLFLCLLLGEGGLRKWVFPSAQEAIYFLKDLLLFCALFRLLFRTQPPLLPAIPFRSIIFRILLGAFVLYLFGQSLNPRLPSLALMIFGVRGYILPLLALVVFFNLITLHPSLGKQLTSLILLSLLPLAILGTSQSLLPADHPLNRYVEWSEIRIATLGIGKDGPARVTSSFSYITGYTDYLYLVTLLILTLYLLRRLSLGVTSLLLFLSVHQMILTGSRGVLIASALAFLLLFLFTVIPILGDTGGSSERKVLSPSFQLLTIGLLTMAFLLLLSNTTTFRLFRQRWEGSDVGERLYLLVHQPFRVSPDAGLLGFGPGSEHQSRSVLLREVSEYPHLPPFYEEESARVFLELGIVGGTLWYLLWFTILLEILYALGRSWMNREGEAALLLLLCFLFTLHLVLTGIVYKTGTAYLWALLYTLVFAQIPSSSLRFKDGVFPPGSYRAPQKNPV